MPSDVVIVAHNAGALLAEAVTSAAAQAGAQHVWVVDAQSTDGSVDAVRTLVGKDYARLHVMQVNNDGFAAGTNRGLVAGEAPFVLLLNPDAVLLPGALAALEASLQADPQAGIVGALVLNPDGTVQAASSGRFPSLASAAGLRLRRTWRCLLGNTSPSPEAPGSAAPVDWVTGAAMLVRRSAIDAVGLLDEGFFLYYEDVDWCWRMRAAGWHVLLEPAAQVLHHRGRSAVPPTAVADAYRASFYRYCDLRGLWGLKAASRIGLSLRRSLGGKS